MRSRHRIITRRLATETFWLRLPRRNRSQNLTRSQCFSTVSVLFLDSRKESFCAQVPRTDSHDVFGAFGITLLQLLHQLFILWQGHSWLSWLCKLPSPLPGPCGPNPWLQGKQTSKQHSASTASDYQLLASSWLRFISLSVFWLWRSARNDCYRTEEPFYMPNLMVRLVHQQIVQ